MARSSQLIVLLLGTFLLISLMLEAQGKPSISFNRRKRQAEEYYDSPNINMEDNFDDSELYDRDVRRSDTQTFPPFPGYDYDSWPTEEPETTPRSAPPLVVPTSSERIEIINETFTETEKPFHRKVVPWFKRQWGATTNFFKKHYDNISG